MKTRMLKRQALQRVVRLVDLFIKGHRSALHPFFQEVDLLETDSVIYKLVGPVLVKQDVNDAKMNVSKRIEFIQKQL